MTSGVLHVAVRGVGLLGPGFADWAQGQALLRQPGGWIDAATAVPAPARLPATERRRAGTVVKASIVVADQACADAGLDPATLTTVFTSSTGDPLNCHLLCEALAGPDRLLSPTRFTNSVHNAAAGYWHIATQSRQASTSLAAFDASFGMGLLEAAAQCLGSGAPVLLVACDVPYPEPLHRLRALPDVFALALVITPATGDWAAQGQPMTVQLVADADAAATGCLHPGLERLRQAIPAAQALPLLHTLALRQAGRVLLPAPVGLAGLAIQVDLAPDQGGP